jgi:hypothetical protein
VGFPRAGFSEQPGYPPQFADRVPGDFVIVHRGATAEGGVIGGLGERVPGGSLRFIGRHLLVFGPGREWGREMRGEGAGQYRGWSGFAEPGQHPDGDPERVAEEQPGAVGVFL